MLRILIFRKFIEVQQLPCITGKYFFLYKYSALSNRRFSILGSNFWQNLEGLRGKKNLSNQRKSRRKKYRNSEEKEKVPETIMDQKILYVYWLQ